MPTPNPSSSYLLQESGSGYFLLEDGSGFILLENQGPSPVPSTPTGGGRGHGSKRRYVKLRDGRQFEVESDRELQTVVQHIIDQRAEQPAPKKAKASRKIRPRAKKVSITDRLDDLSDWSGLYNAFSQLQSSVITEQMLLDLIRNTVLAELQDEQDIEILLLLA